MPNLSVSRPTIIMLAFLSAVLMLLPISPAKAQEPITGGYVLTHEHPMNAMAFGGNYAFAGREGNFNNGIMLEGYTEMVPGCSIGEPCDYGMFRGILAGELAFGADMGVHRAHWGPKQDAFAHARYSTEWIKEAWSPPDPLYQDTRLKIMVALAVESYSMCETLYEANKDQGGPGGEGYPCVRGDSLASNERQIGAIKAWVAENSDWMEIAYSAGDARRIATSGKLVIILGIESDYDFGAEDKRFDPVGRLDHYYDLGVRTFYLAHKLNSRLAGADIFGPGHTQAGKAIRANQAIAGCLFYDDSVDNFPLKNKQGHSFCDNNCGDGAFKGNKLFGLLDSCAHRPGEISEANTIDYIMTRGGTDGTFNGFRIYPQTPGFNGPGGSFEDKETHKPVIVERNNLGLSHDGERVVRAAMLKGMLVNLDHVSSRARQDLRRISGEFGDYPLNGMHTNPNHLLKPKKTLLSLTRYLDEFNFDESELDMIVETGGFFGVRVGPLEAEPNSNSGVDIECPDTITETAKVLAHLLYRGLSVGYSLDYATITKGVYSRTAKGNRSCREMGPDHLHTYLDRKSGRTFTTEGLAHIGVMQQWHRELEAIGLKDEYLDQLRNDGPEQFIQMWERAEAKSSEGEQIPRRVIVYNPPPDVECRNDSECDDGQFCSRGLLPGISPSKCVAERGLRDVCREGRHCASGRCGAGLCATAHECDRDSDCGSGRFCKTPLGIAEARVCEAKLTEGRICINGAQCASNCCKPHISTGFALSCRPSNKCR